MGLIPRKGKKQNKADSLQKAMKMAKNIKTAFAAVGVALKSIPFLTAMWLAITVVTLITSIFTTIISYISDITSAKRTVDKTYSTLDVQDLSELVEIKYDISSGYYIDFKEGASEKLKDLSKVINNEIGGGAVPDDEDFLKELIKAELITEFPDLGGKVPEGSDGFQGAVELKRITPNKKIGELKLISKGETANIEQESSNDPNEDISAYEKIVKEWKAGQTLVINNTAYAYEQQESQLNPGQDTGNWRNVYDSRNKKIEIKKGTKVTYTGTYKVNTNQSSKVTSTYVQVKINDDKIYFVKAQYLSTEGQEITDDSETTTSSITRNVSKIASVTSREKKKTLGKENKTYKIALRATLGKGIETDDINEKDEAEKVLKKLKKLLEDKYSNVEVYEKDTRADIRTVKPDFAIVIGFNSDSDKTKNGVDSIYRDGDEPSHQLGNILTTNVAKSMGLSELSAGSDEEKLGLQLTGIDHYLTCKYPSILIRGGYLSSDSDVEAIKDDGVNKYAEGLLKGIEEYVKSDKSGLVATKQKEQTAQDSIESNVVKMKFLPEIAFKTLIGLNNKEALNYYTINDQFQIETATWSLTDGKLKIEENTAIDFRTSLKKFIIPYEYMLFYYSDSGDEDFSLELAQKAQEAEIVVALQDNIEDKKTEEVVSKKMTSSPDGYGTDWQKSSTKTTTTETCSTRIEYTYIDTWCVKLYKESSYSNKVLNMKDEDDKKDNVDLKGTATYTKDASASSTIFKGSTTEDKGNGLVVTTKNYERTETTIETWNHAYDTGETKIEGKENTFVKLYQDNKMKNQIRASWFFEILEENEKTSNMVDLTKYLIYKATSDDYGVVEFDFNTFNLDSFSDAMGDLATFKEYLHQWEGHEGLSPDGTKYRVGDDGAGHPTVGYGVDIYNSGFKDRFLAAGYDINIGSYIDKDFVDALEDEEIQGKLHDIEQRTAGLNLKIYQKYALLSRAYNCGSAGAFRARNGITFLQAYAKYWNEATDDEYKKTKNDGMYNHPLYTSYMNLPNTSGGKVLAGLERRRKSEWILFKTGYYDNIDKWCSESEGGTIVEKAVEVHKYLRTNNYTYAQTGGSVPRTSTKKIDCSSYVTWVLIESNVSGFTAGMAQWNSATFNSNPMGWQVVSTQDAQPGDIAVYSGHVEIIAQNDPNKNKFTVYSCGSNKSIGASGSSELPESSTSGYSKSSATKILRVPI